MKTMAKTRIAAVLCGVISACGATPEAMSAENNHALTELIKAAEQERELSFLGSGIEAATFSALEKEMRAKYKINIRLSHTYGPSMPRMASRLIQEHKAERKPSTDLYKGYENHVVALLKNDALMAIDWKRYIPKELYPTIAPKGAALMIGNSFTGFSYNTKLVKDAPTTFEDLLKPEWKGRIGTTPYAAFYPYIAILAGQDKFAKFAEQFLVNVGGVLRCSDGDNAVVSGQFALFGFVCSPDTILEMKGKGAPVDFAAFTSVKIMMSQYIAIPKKSKSPNLATLVAIFLQTNEGYRIMKETENLQGLYLQPGTAANARYQNLSKDGSAPKLIDAQFVLENIDTINRLEKLFQNKIRATGK
jgi:ABC-type Fe3+ transport system substrate-binding protein